MFFFFNDTATTEIYTLSLHDALPICTPFNILPPATPPLRSSISAPGLLTSNDRIRSEEHTSELQSQSNLVCRLLLEKKKGMSRYTTVRDTITSSSTMSF